MNIKETENRFGVTIQTQGYYERHEIREIHRKLSEIIAGWDEHALPIEVPRTAGEPFDSDKQNALLIAALREQLRQAREPILCRKCGKPVEHKRECYVTPLCYDCLPPPPPIPIAEIKYDEHLPTCKAYKMSSRYQDDFCDCGFTQAKRGNRTQKRPPRTAGEQKGTK